MHRIIVIIATIVSVAVTAVAQTQIYVAPTAAAGGDGSRARPFSSVAEAIRKATAVKGRKVTVNVLPGNYLLTAPIEITASAAAAITVRGTGSSPSRIIGGRPLSGWSPIGNGIMATAYSPKGTADSDIRQLYVDGLRAQSARTPNDGWITVSDMRQQRTADGVNHIDIKFSKSDLRRLAALSANETKTMRVRFFHNWDVTTWRPTTVNVSSSTMQFSGPGVFTPPLNPIQKGSRCVFLDYPEAVDSAGEWSFDRSRRRIIYKPRHGETIGEAFVPTLSRLLTIHGSQTKPVSNITFENIDFECTAHTTPADGDGPTQAAASWPAAIDIAGAYGIVFRNCVIRNTGESAIWFHDNTHGSSIVHCYFYDLGASAVKIGEPTFNAREATVPYAITVDNNIIHYCGQEMPCAAGVLLLQARDVSITHNDIGDLYYSGISAGWTWGYNSATQHSAIADNTIAYNNIHHIGWRQTSDMGGIYTLGEQPRSTIKGNIVHDVLSYDYGGWGIYTDEGSSYLTITDNLVYNTKNGSYNHHYGKANIIKNNIFADGTYYQMQYSRIESTVSFTFTNNIVYYTSGTTLTGNWQKGNIVMDNNIYFNPNGHYDFAGLSWRAWQQHHDAHSLTVDPLFVAPARGDFHFVSTDNARRIGFQPFDYSQAGVYGSAAWRQKAQLPAATVARFAAMGSADGVNRELVY